MTASSQRIFSYVYFIIAIITLISITKRVIGPLNYDIVIINGEVFDGSGSESKIQDIGIIGGEIVRIGNIESKSFDN